MASTLTRYEVLATHPDGRRYLVGYTPQVSRAGLLNVMRKHGDALIGTQTGLWFRIPRANDGVNAVEIVLDSDDLYTMRFVRVRGTKHVEVARVDAVYNDQLQRVFTSVTGLDTRL